MNKRVIAFWLRSFPGSYYYSTRYCDGWRRLFHVLKYWMLFLLSLWILSPFGWTHPIAWMIGWLGFLNLYDWFCYRNDVMARLYEVYPTHRSFEAWPPSDVFLRIKLGWQLVVFLLLLIVAPDRGWVAHIILLYLALGVVFTTHNRLPEKARPVTLFALYLLKSGCVWVCFYPALVGSSGWIYAALAVFFNLAYIPSYYVKKRGLRVSVWARRCMVPFVIKNMVMMGFALWVPAFFFAWLWLVLVTLMETIVMKLHNQSIRGVIGA